MIFFFLMACSSVGIRETKQRSGPDTVPQSVRARSGVGPGDSVEIGKGRLLLRPAKGRTADNVRGQERARRSPYPRFYDRLIAEKDPSAPCTSCSLFQIWMKVIYRREKPSKAQYQRLHTRHVFGALELWTGKQKKKKKQTTKIKPKEISD
jgi:hypothetical protein